MEEESKTKFSMNVEFSFAFKIFKKSYKKVLTFLRSGSIILLVPRGTTKKQALEHAEVSELADEQD